jgi:hypothetical protein
MDYLRRAVAAGFDDYRKISTDTDLEMLRPRDDFQAVITSLMDRGFPIDPFAK